MPKKVDGYECDLCTKLFDNEGQAKSCEDAHVVPTSYRPVYDKGSARPAGIAITFKNSSGQDAEETYSW